MATVRTSPICQPVRFVLLLAMLLFSAAIWSAELKGRVVGITDGDTITFLDDERNQHKIRLAYIDAPERRQAFGNQARRLLSDLAFGRSASVEHFGRDRYGRVIGRVTIEGQDINLAMITPGMAWHDYWDRQEPSMRKAYARAELQAREARIGLLNEPRGQPDFHRSRRKGLNAGEQLAVRMSMGSTASQTASMRIIAAARASRRRTAGRRCRASSH